MPFRIVGWIPYPENVCSTASRFSEFRNFMFLIPLYIVASVGLGKREWWRSVILSIYAVSAGIALLGVLEYVFPGIRVLLPGFMSDPSAMISGGGFARARFSFWGGPHATFICVLAMPFTLLVSRSWPSPRSRGLTAASLALQFIAIDSGGCRARVESGQLQPSGGRCRGISSSASVVLRGRGWNP